MTNFIGQEITSLGKPLEKKWKLVIFRGVYDFPDIVNLVNKTCD